MPKELIKTSDTFRGDDESTTLFAELRWGRNGYAQLATVQLDVATHAAVEESVNGGWFVSLDRATINALIRNLRRARDNAFGKDE